MKTSMLHTLITTTLMLLGTSAAQADSFTLFIYESKADIAARTDKAKAASYWAAYSGYAQAMTEAGILRGGTALPGSAETQTVSLAGGTSQASDKPPAPTELELGGYFIIEVPHLAAALEWARKSPSITTGSVKVAPHYANPAMPAQ